MGTCFGVQTEENTHTIRYTKTLLKSVKQHQTPYDYPLDPASRLSLPLALASIMAFGVTTTHVTGLLPGRLRRFRFFFLRSFRGWPCWKAWGINLKMECLWSFYSNSKLSSILFQRKPWRSGKHGAFWGFFGGRTWDFLEALGEWSSSVKSQPNSTFIDPSTHFWVVPANSAGFLSRQV